jgi:hypothetical protein
MNLTFLSPRLRTTWVVGLEWQCGDGGADLPLRRPGLPQMTVTSVPARVRARSITHREIIARRVGLTVAVTAPARSKCPLQRGLREVPGRENDHCRPDGEVDEESGAPRAGVTGVTAVTSTDRACLPPPATNSLATSALGAPDDIGFDIPEA